MEFRDVDLTLPVGCECVMHAGLARRWLGLTLSRSPTLTLIMTNQGMTKYPWRAAPKQEPHQGPASRREPLSAKNDRLPRGGRTSFDPCNIIKYVESLS